MHLLLVTFWNKNKIYYIYQFFKGSKCNTNLWNKFMKQIYETNKSQQNAFWNTPAHLFIMEDTSIFLWELNICSIVLYRIDRLIGELPGEISELLVFRSHGNILLHFAPHKIR